MSWTRTTNPSAGGTAGAAEKIFDPEKYLAANADVARSGGDAQKHYNEFGKGEGREGFWKDVDPTNTLNGSDQWSANVSITPEQQRALGSQMRIQEGRSAIGESFLDRLSKATGSPMDYSGLGKNELSTRMFGFGGSPGTAARTEERQALSKGSDYSDKDIQDYAAQQGWVKDGKFDDSKANDLYLHAKRMGVGGAQLDKAGGWAAGTSDNWVKEKGLAGLSGGSGISADDIRGYADKQGWIKDGKFDGSKAADLYDAAQKFGVSGRQLDEAGGWAAGTADKWVTDSPRQIAATEGPRGPNPFNFDLESFLGQQGQWRQRAQTAVTDFQQPLHDRDRSRLENQLSNMGIQRGSEAWKNEMTDLGDRVGRERLQGLQAGQTESALQFGQGLQSAQFGNTSNQNALSMGINAGNYNSQQRQQQLAEMFAMRSQPLNEMNAYTSGQQVQSPSFPGFAGASAGEAANTGRALQQQYSGALDQYGVQQQQKSQTNSAFSSLASLAAMFAFGG